MKEIWKDIPYYEGIYQVSNKGNIKSFKCGKIKILKPFKSKDGYLSVKLTKNKKEKTLRVHRLVAQTFIPNPLNKLEVNHIGGCKHNNNLNNLEWVTREENRKHAVINGLHKTEKQRKASIANFKKASELNKQKVKISKDGNEYIFNSQKEANDFIGCNKCGCYSVLKGQAKTVYGWSVIRL